MCPHGHTQVGMEEEEGMACIPISSYTLNLSPKWPQRKIFLMSAKWQTIEITGRILTLTGITFKWKQKELGKKKTIFGNMPIDYSYCRIQRVIAKSDGNRVRWARGGRNNISWILSLHALQIDTAKTMNLRTQTMKNKTAIRKGESEGVSPFL